MWVSLLALGLIEPIFGQTEEHYAHSGIDADNRARVYEHTTHLGDSRHHLNFKGLQPGLYTIRVKSQTEESQQQVSLSYEKQQAVVRFPDAAKSNLSLSQVVHKSPTP